MMFIHNTVTASLVFALTLISVIPATASELPTELKEPVVIDTKELNQQLQQELFTLQDKKALIVEVERHSSKEALSSALALEQNPNSASKQTPL